MTRTEASEVAGVAEAVAPGGGRPIRIVGPSWRDPRMHVAATIMTLHLLGQVFFAFEISIAQILICLLTCAAIEVPITLARDRTLAWPASALLTGNGVAFIFRVNGTAHGDWWSTRGGWLFASCAAFSLLTKYALRVGDRHLFNPSNIGLVVCFLLFGTGRVNPLDLWWAPWGWELALAYAVILVGGFTLVRRVSLTAVAAGSWLALAAALAVVAAAGHAMQARWHVGPVLDWSFWWIVVTSPEVLVFVLFMVTDPRTVPRGRVAQALFAVVVGVSSAALAAPQRTEFAVKVAILAGLLVGCALRPVLERVCPAPGSPDDATGAWLRRRTTGGLRPVGAAVASVALVAAIVGASRPAREPLGAGEVVVAAPATDVERPEVDVGPLPPITVDADTGPLSREVDAFEAERLVGDVLEGLEIERRAIAGGDADLAATAVAGARLDDALDRIARGAAGDAVPVV
ncbi:MAG: hypothetical protein GXY13_15445, partial [Acidimicrobiales bacterium]|nr:hypothetical protein [Acidimicrobiales bacterium]